ncbi:MAG: hypothetical protein J6W64_07670 [Bacilli bacterium]|nr:hypothetical protein [Bacilli bacterium]
MNNIVIRNIEPQNIKISGAGEVIGITAVYVNGVNVTEGTVAYVIVPTKTSELINNSGYITNETDPTVPYYVKNISISDISKWNNKQDELVSGVNIKTINSNSLLGSGNIDINTSYSAGTGIEITDENVINNTITSYDDLDNLPTIPTKISDLTNDSDFVESSELAEVAFNGSYLALSNTPDSTSDFTNDGEDGINPFITNQTNGLVNYYDKDFLYNLLPKVSDTDTIINLSPTYSSKLEMILSPTTLSQDGTPTPSSPEDIHVITGENTISILNEQLFNKNTVTFGYYYNENLEYVSADNIELSDYIEVIPSNTYSLSYTKNITTYTNIRVNYFDSNKIIQSQLVDSQNIAGRKVYTFTIPSGIHYINFSATTITNYIDLNTIMLNVGNSALPFNLYTSTSHTVDLGNIEYCKIGDYSDKILKTTGNQKFDISSSTANMYIDISGNTGSSSVTDLSDYIEVNSSSIYTLSYNYINALNYNDRNICFYNEEKTFISGIAYTVASKLKTFVTPNNAKYIRFSYDKNFYEIMLNEGNIPLDYQPYGAGDWYIKKNIGKVVLDGTEENLTMLSSHAPGTNRFRYDFVCANTTSDETMITCLSPTFKGLSWSSIYLYDDTTQYAIATSPAGNYIHIRIPSSVANTTGEFTTWITSNNIDVYYLLQTPTYTQIIGDLAEQLEAVYNNVTSYTGQTNILQTPYDLPFTITATTLKDISNL